MIDQPDNKKEDNWQPQEEEIKHKEPGIQPAENENAGNQQPPQASEGDEQHGSVKNSK